MNCLLKLRRRGFFEGVGYDMEYNKITAFANSVLAFSTSLAVMLALLQYVLPTKEGNFLIILFWSEVYILLHLLFLYMLKKWLK